MNLGRHKGTEYSKLLLPSIYASNTSMDRSRFFCERAFHWKCVKLVWKLLLVPIFHTYPCDEKNLWLDPTLLFSSYRRQRVRSWPPKQYSCCKSDMRSITLLLGTIFPSELFCANEKVRWDPRLPCSV